MPKTELSLLRQRRSYPQSLKAQIVAECARPGASIAAVALSHGINANLLHKWIRLDRARNQAGSPAFVPVLPPPALVLAGRSIEIRLQRGEVQATILWPASEAPSCVAWLREWLP
ncbi:IS66-like element accessory protein TnpA [Microvirgula aerodenitrificans]|uniref:IS66-like element accessory protein TnpA n=1 Tax=Microvirgula aerodenitrificans TaxID=57480 RepID=UPI002F42E8D5